MWKANRCFQPVEGPCRGLLRDCTTSPMDRFSALVIIIFRTNTSSGRTLRWGVGKYFLDSRVISPPQLCHKYFSLHEYEILRKCSIRVCLCDANMQMEVFRISIHIIFLLAKYKFEQIACSKNHCSATHWRIYVTMRQKLLGFFLWFSKGKLKLSKHINFCR